MNNKNGDLFSNSGHIDLCRAAKYSPYAQFFAFYSENAQPDEGLFNSQYSYFLSELKKYGEYISLCKNASEAKKAFGENKTAAFLSVEGAELLGCSTEGLINAHKLGVRAVNITWNHENILSGSCAENPDKGLTGQGKAFVKKCNELGVLIDVSHISEKGFWDVFDISDKPFLASHSNSSAVYPHRRNLTDDQFRAIMSVGGVAGINLYSAFLGEKPSLNTAVRHVLHFIELGGENNISIGADLDGCDELPEGVFGIEGIEKFYNELLKAGIDDLLARKIFFDNLMGVVEKVCAT